MTDCRGEDLRKNAALGAWLLCSTARIGLNPAGADAREVAEFVNDRTLLCQQ